MKPLLDGRTATVYCRCRKIKVQGKRLHGSFGGADAAKALLTMVKANAR
jgi:hypothetical protein